MIGVRLGRVSLKAETRGALGNLAKYVRRVIEVFDAKRWNEISGLGFNFNPEGVGHGTHAHLKDHLSLSILLIRI